MRCRVPHAILFAVVGCLTFGAASVSSGAERAKPVEPRPIDLFEGMNNGELDVRFVAKDDKNAQMIVRNKTKQPLSVKLPEAFAAVPVLAQNFNNNNNNSNRNQNQSIGGGFGGGGFGGGGFGGGGFGGGFNVAPEGVGKLKVDVVCLEHGKPDPNVRIPYQIKPIDSYTDDVRIHETLKAFGQGKLDRRATQAAVWHMANNLSWAELASKTIDRVGRPDEPYFSPAELELAARIARQAEIAARLQADANPESTPGFGDSRDEE